MAVDNAKMDVHYSDFYESDALLVTSASKGCMLVEGNLSQYTPQTRGVTILNSGIFSCTLNPLIEDQSSQSPKGDTACYSAVLNTIQSPK